MIVSGREWLDCLVQCVPVGRWGALISQLLGELVMTVRKQSERGGSGMLLQQMISTQLYDEGRDISTY